MYKIYLQGRRDYDRLQCRPCLDICRYNLVSLKLPYILDQDHLCLVWGECGVVCVTNQPVDTTVVVTMPSYSRAGNYSTLASSSSVMADLQI